MATPRSWSYVLLSPVRGRENVLAKYPVAHPAFPVWEGIEEGVVASHHVYIREFRPLCYRWWVSGRGWEARTFKMQIRKRKREGGSERKSNIVRGRANVRGSASAVASVLSVPASVFLFPFGHPAMPPRR